MQYDSVIFEAIEINDLITLLAKIFFLDKKSLSLLSLQLVWQVISVNNLVGF